MYAEVVTDLFEAYQQLSENNKALMRGIVACVDRPLFLPPEFTTSKDVDLMVVGKALTRLWFDDKLTRTPYSGLLCATDEVIEQAVAVNQSKARFEDAIKAVIEAEEGLVHRKKEVFRLIEKRDPAIAEAMKSIGISRVNLAYVRQRVLVKTKPVDSVSWTWQTAGRKISAINYEAAVEMAKSQHSEKIRDLALDKLGALPAGTPLARVTSQKPQLKANIKWREDGKEFSKLFVTASVLLIPNDKLPDYVWKDLPKEGSAKRLKRSDVKVDQDPYIEALGLHLYVS